MTDIDLLTKKFGPGDTRLKEIKQLQDEYWDKLSVILHSKNETLGERLNRLNNKTIKLH
jgi:hypothetical protein